MAGDPFTAAIFRWLRAIAADPAQPPAAFECAFVINFVAAAWSDLGFPEFMNKRGEPQLLIDAIGNRIEKLHRLRTARSHAK